MTRLLKATQNGGVLNTLFIEHLIATFRSRAAILVGRTRHLVQKEELVVSAVYLVGTVYNFCTYHDALRVPLYVAYWRKGMCHRVERMSAMAAGLTDHRWTVLELLSFKVPPPVPQQAGG